MGRSGDYDSRPRGDSDHLGGGFDLKRNQKQTVRTRDAGFYDVERIARTDEVEWAVYG